MQRKLKKKNPLYKAKSSRRRQRIQWSKIKEILCTQKKVKSSSSLINKEWEFINLKLMKNLDGKMSLEAKEKLERMLQSGGIDCLILDS